ncbi:MAG: ATP-grasp domain-containing protein [Fimbriimonadaceae bacterium]|nr:ATP-grasp domain-containing protein [Fimbriimonadaceae bacterium]
MRKLLVANRGEIAVRVLRAAREMGIRTVAVYSDADLHAPHALLADEAVYLGASEPLESYLRADKILDAARRTGADAIHPGYGFLAESADFAEACAEAGLPFVGPPATAMRRLGAKIAAKRLANDAGVPTVPGYFEPDASEEDLRRAAHRVGYPVLLKASAGGGGRGMRVVLSESEFGAQYRTATDEARNAFGDGAMMVEKLVERPHHVEVQILADTHGQVAALFERECSVQRRHQKLIEEAPSPLFANGARPEVWAAMREAAISLARAAGYVGAGTVEFIVEPTTDAFYFLEVNARLQVEHPVTEAITGVDLVQWQLRIARGERLSLAPPLMVGDRTAIRGHAIEARVVAEDPAQNFAPSTGRLVGWAEPTGPGIRVDTGYGPGVEVPRYYDSLLAKTIVHGESREAARVRLRQALADFHVLGVRTNIAFLRDLLEAPAFLAGSVDTGFVEREFDWEDTADHSAELGLIAGAAGNARPTTERTPHTRPAGPWESADGFRNVR